MNLQITSRDKKFLIAGGTAVGVYLLVVLVIQPVYAKQGSRDLQIQNKIQLIQGYYKILNRKSYYESKNRDNKNIRATLTKKFLNETQPGLAAAGLQKMIEDFARQSGVAIEQVRVEKPKMIEKTPAIPISMTLSSDLNNLSKFIFRIENSVKFLIVEEISTRKVNKSEPEKLQTRLLVNGFIQELSPKKNPHI